MNHKNLYTTAAALLSAALCVLFGIALLIYAKPMEDKFFDLSLFWEGEAAPEDWTYDPKGWTVFTREKETVSLLKPDGYGGFTGLSRPEQTFYFSRKIEEDLDSPTLRIDGLNRMIAVFLDDELLYTDCPKEDNRIGYLNLHALTWDRTEPIIVSLPLDYANKTLTIAQSFSSEKQEPDLTVYPCDVTLYCGYAYESGLISESFQTAIPAALAFAAGTFLLLLFVLQVYRRGAKSKLLYGALLAFFWLTELIFSASFSKSYFDLLPIDVSMLCRDLSLTLLLFFLAGMLTGPRRILSLLLCALQTAALLARLIMEIADQVSLEFEIYYPIVGLIGLFVTLACGFFERKRSRFFRLFCPMTAAGIILFLIVWPWPSSCLSFAYPLWPLMNLMTAESLILLVGFAIRNEIIQRTENNLLIQRAALAQESYETMRRQHEEVMMLRHDIGKHLAVLQKLVKEDQASAYLNELIGENQKIRPVIQSGNKIMDIILNGKLTDAINARVSLEIVNANIPKTLPLSDKDMCALFFNIMDNAVAAATAPDVSHPYIKLNMRTQKNFFLFTCENSTTRAYVERNQNRQDKALQKHCLGQKIIRQIAGRYGNLTETEYGTDYYAITVALPLS